METWDAALAHFGAWLMASGASLGTVKLRRHYLRRLAGHTGEESPWSLTIDGLVGFLGHDPRWRPETRKSARSSVRVFYQWGLTTRRIDIDPSVALPRVKVPRAEPRPAPEEVVQRALLSAAQRRRRIAASSGGGSDRLMVMLAAYEGLRCGEIATLHARNVTEFTMRVLGKGGKWRTLPLHPVVAAELASFTGGYVFPGQVAGHVSAQWVGKLLARHLGRGWTGHTLRHRFGTAIRDVSDVLAAKELLGHASLDTTMIYTRVSEASLRGAVLAAGPAA